MLDLKSEGWSEFEDDGFIEHVGPFFYRLSAEGVMEFAVVAQAKHRNIRGVVQGGLLMTFADRVMGLVAKQKAGPNPLATIQMDTQFVDSAKIGDVLKATPRIIRSTKTVIFTSTDVMDGDRCVAHANAVFKVSRK